MARRPGHRAYPWRPVSPTDAGQDRALASDAQKPSLARKLLSTGRPRGRGGPLRRALQSRPLPRKPPQSHPRGRLLRTRPNHPPRTGKDQTTDDRQSPLAAPRAGRLTSKPDDPEPPLLNPAPRLKLSDDGQANRQVGLLDQADDLGLFGCGVSHAASPPSPIMLFLSRRFSRVRSATTSFKAEASRRRSFTSSDVAARAVW